MKLGGDTLDIQVALGSGAQALITTAGATLFYRSSGEPAVQQSRLRLEAGARLAWLPLEAILYSGCQAENPLSFELAAGAELLAWDVMALGLPHAELPFVCERFWQHIELPGVWLERARREWALDSARQVLHAHALQSVAGVTCPNPRVVVLRGLAPQVEMAMDLLKKIWAVWRQVLWNQATVPPRSWTM